MSSSFIEYKTKGYWIPDGFNELMARFIITTIDTIKHKPDWLLLMREKLYHIAQGHFPGWNSFSFDEYLNSTDRANYFIDILNETVAMLKKKEDFITKEELNSYEMDEQFKSEWVENIETVRIINLIEHIKELLLGKKGYSPEHDTTYIW